MYFDRNIIETKKSEGVNIVSLKLNVIDREGKQTTIDIEEGTTIRNAIDDVLFPDNYGVCGGCCACGTCHVYVKPSDFDKLKAKEDEEIDTLESLVLEPNQYSRLGCQVEFKKEYDNMTVTIAPD